MTDENVPSEERCKVPGHCTGYEPGQPCCEPEGFGTGSVTGRSVSISMGSWVIHIEGQGIHDNERPDDAEAILGRFVEEMIAAGHQISLASFTTGSVRELVSDQDPAPVLRRLASPVKLSYR
jgi:hypothetical protein